MKTKRRVARAAALLLLLTLTSTLSPTTALAAPEETAPVTRVEDPAIQATAAVLLDPESGTFLYEKESSSKRYPASTTKILTALIVLENITDLNEKVTVTEGDFIGVEADSSKAGFLIGEEIPIIDLLYGLMLPSGNEAANTLARRVGGSVEGFVDMMNRRAAELGCENTHFTNPNGLHDENHYTTAKDLSLIAAKAMEHETFATIVDTAQKTLSETNKKAEHGNKALKVFTTNMLIFSRNDPNFYLYARGIKTGYTTPAGYCLVAAAEKKSDSLISVVLGCEKPQGARYPVSFSETKRLFEWGFENFINSTLIEKGMPIDEVEVELSTEVDKLVPQVAQELTAIVPKDIDLTQLELTKHLPEKLRAPIKAGEVIGSMDVAYNGVHYGTVELVAMSDVSMSQVLYYADKLTNFFQSRLFKLIVIALGAILLLYILIIITIGRNRRRKRRNATRDRYRRY